MDAVPLREGARVRRVGVGTVSRELQGLKPLLLGLVMSPLKGRPTKITHKDKLQKRPTEMLGIRAWGPIVASIAMIPIGGGVELGGVPVGL